MSKALTNPQKVRPAFAERLAVALRADCYAGCECKTATLKKRVLSNGAQQLCLQCDGCGRSLGALTKAEVPDFDSLPAFDDARQESWLQAETANARIALAERREKFMAQWAQKRRNYAEFTRKSPEWAELRSLLIQRAGGVCEACLRQPAATAHHLTYDFGKLPPAWLLRAVCHGCHARLHADVHGRVDEWSVVARRVEELC